MRKHRDDGLTLKPSATHGTGGSFSVISSAHIAASPDVVFSALLSHREYPSWNRFVRLVTVTSTGPSPTCEPNTSSAEADSTALETALLNDDGSRYLRKGMQMTFQVHLDPDNARLSTGQGMEVTVLEPFDPQDRRRGWRVAWRGTSMPSFVLRTERVQEFVDDGRGGTEYTCWETFYGPAAPVTRLATGRLLQKGFRCWTEDLKATAEKIAAGGREETADAAGGALGTTQE